MDLTVRCTVRMQIIGNMMRFFKATLWSLFLTALFGNFVYPQQSTATMREMMNDEGAPAIGELAPVFMLKSLDGRTEFELQSYRGEKPVILYFGSYT